MRATRATPPNWGDAAAESVAVGETFPLQRPCKPVLQLQGRLYDHPMSLERRWRRQGRAEGVSGLVSESQTRRLLPAAASTLQHVRGGRVSEAIPPASHAG